MSSLFLIAEAASCHEGNLGIAIEMIGLARKAGADAVKFQFWSDADRLADRRQASERYRDAYRRCRVPADWLPHLRTTATQHKIQLGITGYLPEDVVTLRPFVDFWKCASFEADAEDLREAIGAAQTGQPKPVIVSTGMMDATAVKALRKDWGKVTQATRVHLLHCVSDYRPCPVEACNLRTIRALELQGFSDHTASVTTGAIAVGYGAKILEVHFRSPDTERNNLDYPCALSPRELAEYIALARQADAMGGDGQKRMQPGEAEMAAYRAKMA